MTSWDASGNCCVYIFLCRRSWENAIHLYKGPDPLEYWYHYVNWYEQNYCYDSTNKMSEIIQKVLTQFNNINAYKQDHRMVKVWLKYVSDFISNPARQPADQHLPFFRSICSRIR